MKKLFSKKLQNILFFGVLFIGLPIMVNLALTEQDPRQYAQEITPVYLIPSSEKILPQQELIIALQIKPKPTSIKSVQINLTYPADKLSVPTISYNNSPFQLANEQIVSPGFIKIGREASIPIADEKQIASLKFIASSRVTPQEIKLAPGSFAVSGVDNKHLPVTLTIVDSSYYQAQANNGFLGPFLNFLNDINPF